MPLHRLNLCIRQLIILSVLIFPVTAQAAIINLTATLDGNQEVPPSGSLATGIATLTYDDLSNILSWNITFSGLSGLATGAHFHGPAPAGINAAVELDIGAISGLGSPMIGSSAISNAQATDLLNDLWYINIHTDRFPGGEIRGQVIGEVPLPAAIWLFGAGILMLFGGIKITHKS